MKAWTDFTVSLVSLLSQFYPWYVSTCFGYWFLFVLNLICDFKCFFGDLFYVAYSLLSWPPDFNDKVNHSVTLCGSVHISTFSSIFFPILKQIITGPRGAQLYSVLSLTFHDLNPRTTYWRGNISLCYKFQLLEFLGTLCQQ